MELTLPKRKPCRKCGSTDLEVLNCGYSSFNVGHVKCKSCGHTVTVNHIDWNSKGTVELIRVWNKDKARGKEALTDMLKAWRHANRNGVMCIDLAPVIKELSSILREME